MAATHLGIMKTETLRVNVTAVLFPVSPLLGASGVDRRVENEKNERCMDLHGSPWLQIWINQERL